MDRHGSVDMRNGTGLLLEMQEAYRLGRIARLAEAWYRQSLVGGLASVMLDRAPLNLKFAAFACDFQNQCAVIDNQTAIGTTRRSTRRPDRVALARTHDND